MRLIKAIFVVAPIAIAVYIGSRAIEQFEHFTEAGGGYLTPFHEVNLIALVFLTVALIAAAVCIARIDIDSEEIPVPFRDYLLSVVFGTAGMIAIAIAWFEGETSTGSTSPIHLGHGYNSGDAVALWVAGVALILIAIYYLLGERDGYGYGHASGGFANTHRSQQAGPAPAPQPAGNGGYNGGIDRYSARMLYDYLASATLIQQEILRDSLMSALIRPVYRRVPRVQLILIGPEVLEPEEDAEDQDEQILIGYVLTVDGELVDHEFIVINLVELEDEESDKPKGDEPDKPVKPAGKTQV